ncbi:Integrator complex subunit 4 [Mortierella hygrophila]|uniref:Integrator complex subunit 4 n=1 Tax=Mortierella hygrophila TaxID=979708 RepID=A0A9P6FEC2_9FUNG|nr:Integrator complex subunit 4 [Mortierella hygrophila]
MKRPNQDDSQDATIRGKQARTHGQPAVSVSGSHTVVQSASLLALQPHADGDDMNVDSDHELDREDATSMDEDLDQDSDLEGELTNQDLLRSVDSRSARTRTRALKLLINRLADLTSAERESLLKIARKNLYTEGDKGVKILLIQILQNALEATTVDGRSVVEDLLNQLQADSTEVRVQVYDAIAYIIKIGRLQRSSNSDINTIRALITTSIAELSDRHHRVRSALLQLVSQLAPLLRTSDVQTNVSEGKQAGYSQHDIQVIISNYVTDPEPRVRKNALKALLGLHRQGFKIGLVMYDVAILAILDDYQEVRMEGLDLIFILSRLYPDQIVQNPKEDIEQRTRLADDAFVRICDMMNDSSMVVRAKACTLLGRFRKVNYMFLSQTFSKQIMARLKVDQSSRNIALGPAQKQAQRAKLIATPEGDQDVTAQQVRLLDSGACGAFVHGLEDEYQDVRNAAINSICELCLHNSGFAVLALDYLVDMFMDEIDYVRMNALTSLRKIGNRGLITFDTEQLQIALGVLEDADRDVREAAHRMLEVVTMSTEDGMTSFLESIETNMRRFPEDQLSIYQCLRYVGRHHGVFLENMLDSMLQLDPTFLAKEKNVEEMTYCGHMVLLFNAATTNPTILNMLPKYTFKHYTYLRDEYLNCFPEPTEIPCPGTQSLRDLAAALTMTITNDGPDGAGMNIDSMTSAQDGATSAYATTIAAMRIQTEEDAEAFYEQALRNLDRIHVLLRQQTSSNQSRARPDLTKRHREVLLRQLSACQRDLEYIVSVHTKQGRNAEFASMYLECCQLLVQIQESYDSPSFIMLAPILSAQLFRLSYYMDHIFLGLDATAKVSVGYFRILANLVWFFGMVQKKAGTSASSSSSPSAAGPREDGLTREYLQSMLQQAIKRVTDLQAQMDRPEVDLDRIKGYRVILGDLRVALLRAFKSPSTLEVVRLLANIVKFRPMEIDFRNLDLHRISAEVTRPTTNRDRPTDIHPSFPFLVPVEGVIHHARDTTGVAIQVTFPNGNVRHYYPPPDHFIPVEDGESKDKSDEAEAKRESEDSAAMDVVSSTATGETLSTPSTYRLRTSIEIYPEASWGTSSAELRITLSRSFQPDLVGHDEFICRFAEEIATEKRQQQALQQRGMLTDPNGQGQSSFSSTTPGSGSSASTGLLSHPRGLLALGGSGGGGGQMSSRRLRSVATPGSEAHVMQNQSTLEISKSINYYVARRAMFNS